MADALPDDYRFHSRTKGPTQIAGDSEDVPALKVPCPECKTPLALSAWFVDCSQCGTLWSIHIHAESEHGFAFKLERLDEP